MFQIATVTMGPGPPAVYLVFAIQMICAFFKGMRMADCQTEPVGAADWLRHACRSGGGIPWLVISTISFHYLIYHLMWDGTIPFWPRSYLSEAELNVFWVIMFAVSFASAVFFRVSGVRVGFSYGIGTR